jgi:dihydroflavonol-4-reductase
MHVFVTGATGFIGFHTVRALLEAGHTVRLGVRNVAKMKALYDAQGLPVDDFAVGEIIDNDAPIAITYPSGVLGPQDPAMSEGNQGLAIFFNQTFVLTSLGMQVIDVRDLAKVHVALLEQKKTGSYLVSGHFRSWDELGQILDRITDRKLRKLAIPGWLLRALAGVVETLSGVLRFNTPLTPEAAMYGTQWVYVDDRKVRGELNISYRPIEQTLADTIGWLADSGHIETYWAQKLVSQ